MQSIIITSNNKTEAEQHALSLCLEQGVHPVDISFVRFEKKDEESKKQSIGILEIREILEKISLKPIRGSKKAVIIIDAHLLTSQAQNALLKVLEEPPPSTILILVAQKKESLLPTICSRCTIIELKRGLDVISEEEDATIHTALAAIASVSQEGNLKLAQDISAERSEVLIWLEKAIQVARKQLIDHVTMKQRDSNLVQQYLSILKALQQAHTTAASTNVNMRLLLENLFLNSGNR